MLDLTKDFMHVEPHQKKKIQLLESATICHIDESALFQDQVCRCWGLQSRVWLIDSYFNSIERRGCTFGTDSQGTFPKDGFYHTAHGRRLFP